MRIKKKYSLLVYKKNSSNKPLTYYCISGTGTCITCMNAAIIYFFRAFNKHNHHVYFLCLVPSQPENLTNFEVTNTSILIQWDAPEQPNGPLLPYVVKVLEYNNNNKTMDMESKFANYTVEGLLPYVNYSVKVCAQTEAGRGEWTEELDFRTEIGSKLNIYKNYFLKLFLKEGSDKMF